MRIKMHPVTFLLKLHFAFGEWRCNWIAVSQPTLLSTREMNCQSRVRSPFAQEGEARKKCACSEEKVVVKIFISFFSLRFFIPRLRSLIVFASLISMILLSFFSLLHKKNGNARCCRPVEGSRLTIFPLFAADRRRRSCEVCKNTVFDFSDEQKKERKKRNISGKIRKEATRERGKSASRQWNWVFTFFDDATDETDRHTRYKWDETAEHYFLAILL